MDAPSPIAPANRLRRAFLDLRAIDGAQAPGCDPLLPAAPRVFSHAVLAQLGATAERLWAALDTAVRSAVERGSGNLARELGFDAGDAALIAATPSLLPPPVRADFVPTKAGYRLVEWNVDPCLGGLASRELFTRFAQAGVADGLTFLDPAEALAPSFARLRDRATHLVVAIRATDLDAWGTNAERIAEIARGAGLDARVLPLDEAVRYAEAASPASPVAVLRLFHIEHVASVRAQVDRLLACVRAGRALLVYGFDTELWGDKQWLGRVVLPCPLARFVPETRAPRDVEALLATRRASWVLKPHAASAGQGVLIGREADAATWSAAVERALTEPGWVAQRLVEPRTVVGWYAGTEGARAVSRREVETLGIFLVEGRYAGAYARSQPVEDGLVVDAGSSFNVVATRPIDFPGDSVLPESLRRLWATATPAIVRRRLRQFEDLALTHLTGRGGARAGANPSEASSGFRTPRIPAKGAPIVTVVRELRDSLLPFCHDKRAPTYVAHMDVPPADLSIASGVLIRALAQDPVTWTSSRAGTFVENEVLRWLADLVFSTSNGDATGVACAGGTQANLLAVLLARNLALGALGHDVPRLGLAEALRRAGRRTLPVISSCAAHGSVVAAVRNAGIGDDNHVRIAVDGEDRMRLDLLEEALAKAAREGDPTALVVLTAGTVGTGAVDPLFEATALARKHGARVHVDAAHGALLLFSRRYRARLTGIELADTVTCDPHKILGLNQGFGTLLVRNGADREAVSKDHAPYFLASAGAPETWRYSLDGTRPLNALGAWILMRHLGRDGYERIVDHLMDLAAAFEARLRATGSFELHGPPTMNLVAFRPTRGLISGPGTAADDARVTGLVEQINRGHYRASRYTSARGTFLRAVFVNPATTGADVSGYADMLDELAHAEEAT